MNRRDVILSELKEAEEIYLMLSDEKPIEKLGFKHLIAELKKELEELDEKS